uniref:Uncharacterized protein n=1 Tax=Chenopodium quinoa TaxID=63459 RepID=A0A803LFB6_CHEQI
MSCSRLKRGRIQLQAMSKVVWKKLTKSTKLLHKLITHGSKKLIVINKPRKTNIKTPLYLSPRRTALKRKKLYKKYKFPPVESPIYIDNLFKTSYPSSSSSKLTMQVRDKIDNVHENSHVGAASLGSTTSVLGIDARAEEFIASFRAELNKSFRNM